MPRRHSSLSSVTVWTGMLHIRVRGIRRIGAAGCDRQTAEEDWRCDCGPIYLLAVGGGSPQ